VEGGQTAEHAASSTAVTAAAAAGTRRADDGESMSSSCTASASASATRRNDNDSHYDEIYSPQNLAEQTNDSRDGDSQSYDDIADVITDVITTTEHENTAAVTVAAAATLTVGHTANNTYDGLQDSTREVIRSHESSVYQQIIQGSPTAAAASNCHCQVQHHGDKQHLYMHVISDDDDDDDHETSFMLPEPTADTLNAKNNCYRHKTCVTIIGPERATKASTL